MEPQKNRIFIGIPIGDSIRNTLKDGCELLKPKLPFQKWVNPDDYHITLKYLGETDATGIQQVKSNLETICRNHGSFSLWIEGLGIFGKPEAPQILWAGVKGELNSLAHLHQKIEDAMRQLQFNPEERSYSPHLTLARRYQGRADSDFLKQVTLPNEEPCCLEVDQVILYESFLGRQPMYQPLAGYSLYEKTRP
jgi:2'-5' RNA ligase